MNPFFWWIRQTVLTLAGCVFLLFGINILKLSYTQNDPFTFILVFFSSNLIILISTALILGFICRMYRVFKQLGK